MHYPFTASKLTPVIVSRLCRGSLGFVISFGLTFPISGWSQEGPLTLLAAQQQAVEHSRQIAAKTYGISSSREMAVAAGQLPDPILKAGIDNLPINGPDRFSLTNDFMTMRRIGVMQELTRTDKRQARSERFGLEAEKGLAEKTFVVASVERATALAWLDLYYAQAAAAVITEQKTQANLEVQAVEGAYRAGRGNQADILAARSAVATIDNQTSEAQRRILSAKTILARWIGRAADMPLAGKPPTDKIRLDPATLDTVLVHHPEIAIVAKQVEIAAAEVKLAEANKHADWSVEVAYQQRGPAYSNMVSVGISVPLQWDQKNRQERELSSKLAMVEQAKAERDDMVRDHVAQTRAMIYEWENGKERQQRYENELIPLANDRTGAVIGAYRGGKATLSEVLAARRNVIDTRLQSLQLEAETARLWAQLNYLFPTDADESHQSMPTVDSSK